MTTLILGSLFGLLGCEEYYTVDDACAENLVGGSTLGPVPYDALDRINCYRRLSGVTKGTANEQVQIAANREMNYIAANPNPGVLIGPIGAKELLDQANEESEAFTGSSIYDRLEQAGYSLYDIAGTGIWEYIAIVTADTPAELPSGKAAVDFLMRDAEFRQVVMQPSWIDGAYAEVELGQNWWIEPEFEALVNTGTGTTTGTTFTLPPGPSLGRAYYFVVLYQAPHFEHVDRPVLVPKEDQTDVPLYSWSADQDVLIGGLPAPVQISYPVTLTVGAVDPQNYREVDQNQYSAQIKKASLIELTSQNDPKGTALETEVVHPGDAAELTWPGGRFLRTTLAVYTNKPFKPDNWYRVFANMVTPEYEFEVDYTFKTRAEDPGLIVAPPLTGARSVDPGARGLRIVSSGSRIHGPLSLPSAP
ncbi:MAG: hypothetical protein ABMB14_31215 [Myxococcota bacterium]